MKQHPEDTSSEEEEEEEEQPVKKPGGFRMITNVTSSSQGIFLFKIKFFLRN